MPRSLFLLAALLAVTAAATPAAAHVQACPVDGWHVAVPGGPVHAHFPACDGQANVAPPLLVRALDFLL